MIWARVRLAAMILVVSMPVATSNVSARVLQRHDDILERAIARAFADAVHGAFDLPRARRVPPPG